MRFRYYDREFIVLEPYGDNSRYWIGPDGDANTSVDVTELRLVFDHYTPSPLVKFFGDIVTLNFRALFHCDT
jgi:hypothetical protein